MRMVTGSLAVAALVAAAPAAADVKAGVDAWGRGDWPRAVAEWRPLAVQGDADAQFNLGQAYKLGRGVPTDPAQALAWFKRAADQGHLQAEDNYGIGLFQAQLVLGTMLFNGDGVRADYPRAYALMTRASQAGLPSASQSLAQMDGFITPADRERGTQRAQQYAAQVQAGPAPACRRATTVPHQTPPVAAPMPRQVAASRPVALRPVASRPAAAGATGGAWRVQLGAFRDRGNAEALWNRVRARVGGQPAYIAGRGVTRLQATGFAGRAAAQRACAASGITCVVVAPRRQSERRDEPRREEHRRGDQPGRGQRDEPGDHDVGRHVPPHRRQPPRRTHPDD